MYEANFEADNITKLVHFVTGKNEYLLPLRRQWDPTRKLTSPEFLDLLKRGAATRNLPRYFDFLTFHQKCITLGSDIFEAHIDFMDGQEGNEWAKELLREFVQTKDANLDLTMVILAADPGAHAAVESLKKDFGGRAREFHRAGISPAIAASVMKGLIQCEGQLQLDKAKALYPANVEEKLDD